MTATPPSPPPARLQVVAVEYRLARSRPSVGAGAAIVELANFGQDAHDLALRRAAAGSRTWRIGTVQAGKVADRTVRLLPGRYLLWCTLAGHRARGMAATLLVRAALAGRAAGRGAAAGRRG